jgi:hypothetical protein
MATTIDSSTILDQMSALQYEPTRIIPLLLGMTEDAFDGTTIMTDPSAPFPHLMEMAVVLAMAGIQEDEILNTRQYPIMAVDDETLFYHLSDVDFVGMFAEPAVGTFSIYFEMSEIIANAVAVGTTGTKRITIPKHTRIVVNNTAFTFQYPINFIVKKNGGLDIVYDGSTTSPLQTLAGNKVTWQTVTTVVDANNGGAVEMVRIDVPINQMLLTSYTYSLSAAKSLKKVLTLTDSFYYVRAFSMNSSTGLWDEIKTTNSTQVFDPTDPTLLYSLVDDELTIQLPYVYFATSLVQTDIRVDVYTTKGPITMALSGLQPTAFVATFSDLDNDDSGIYTAPLGLMSTISIISTDLVTGGTAAPTFDVRRERALNNAVGDAVIPISDAQMGTDLSELGFDSMMNIDNVTMRSYLATRAMPVNADGKATTGIDSAIITAKFAVTDLAAYSTFIDNGDRYTLTPVTLYRYIDGVLTIVSDADRIAIDKLTGDDLINKVGDGTYLWTPLHYVLDTADNGFVVRPYFLNSPSIDVKSFVASNDTLGLTVSSGSSMSIVRDEQGYLLTVQSSSSTAWQTLLDSQVHVQLAFIPYGESDYAYVNGVQIAASGERIFTFRIDSNWDLDSDHNLTTTNFDMYEAEARDCLTPLSNAFSLIWSVSDYTVSGASSTEVDTVLGKFLLPSDAIGVYHETLTLELGDQLSGLWAQCRSMASLRKYVTYTAIVYGTYASNIYELDANGMVVLYEDANGVKQLKISHAKGDQILDADGKPVILHSIGDAVLDQNGNPTLESERNITRWWDVCLFDGVYRYATEATDVAYVKDVPLTLNEWINDTLAPIRAKLLERSDLFFQPRNTLKQVEATVQDSEDVTINTSQSLIITLWVSKVVYGNADLRSDMETTTIARVVAGLDNQRVARNVIEADIYSYLGDDVIGVSLTGLGGAANDYDVITLADTSSRLCIAKALEAEADGTYAVVDAIEVDFKLHQLVTTS